MSYRYILRYYIDPGFNEDDRIAELVEYCRNSRIAEVMFFYNPEELCMGYPPPEEIDKWFNLAKKVKTALSAHGIALSLNPWGTTVHVARGRILGPEQNFQRMVGETGAVSSITACPLDKNWQIQLADLFCRMAVEIAPSTIWIEDDWRLHNHGADMKYGGCFCPLHLQKFAEKTGIHTDRETLLKNITAPGQPHPWRQPWLEVCGESLREPAQYLQERIHAVAPQVKLGLMASLPDYHSIEGRDWAAFKAAFAPEGKLAVRPNLPPYTERHTLECLPAHTMQMVSELPPEELEIYPELENSPRCGAYSKSRAYSAWEIASSVVYGAQGITINHYDMMGNGTALDPRYGEMLAALRPQLDAVTDLGLNVDNLLGVDVFHTPRVANSMHSKTPGSCWGILANSVSWGDTLGVCGISYRLTRHFDPQRLTAVSSATLWALSESEIRQMLHGKLLLDADSVKILCERGFAAQLGVTGCAPGGDDGHAFEVIEDDDAPYYGVGFPRMCAQRDGHYLVMHPVPEAEVWSTIRKYDRSVLYPGLIKFTNAWGGTVWSSAHFMEQEQFFMAYFNIFRAKFLQRLVAAAGTPAVWGENYPLNVYCNKLDKGYIITVLNPALDALEQVKLHGAGLQFERVDVLTASGQWRPVDWNKLPGLAPLDVLYLRLQ